MRKWCLFLSLIAGLAAIVAGCAGGDGGTPDSSRGTDTTAPAGASWTLLKLPDTGQTTHYSTAFGDDASYTIKPPSYTDNGNNTITDNVTGLVWQKQDDGTKRTWTAAGTYCDALSHDGHTDWRLPSDIELMSIVDYGRYNPAINTMYFPNTHASDYWSFSTNADDTDVAWYVHFDDGSVGSYHKWDRYYVRCVRGGQ